MREVVAGTQAEQDIHVAETEVSVEKEGFRALLGESNGQINSNIGLAHPAFTAGDGNYLDWFTRTHSSKSLRLIQRGRNHRGPLHFRHHDSDYGQC